MKSVRKFSVKEFSVYRSGFRIAGSKYCPEKANGIPVIISHGFLVNRRSVQTYAETLASAGFTAYSYDFVGGSPSNDSEGTMSDMTLLTEKEDLLSVMEFVKEESEEHTSKPVLLGCSQGGFVSALVAAEHPDEVLQLVLFYPALCIPDDARKGNMMFFRFDPEHIPEKVSLPGGRVCISREYIESAKSLNALEAILPYNGDVLIIHGTDDRIVRYFYAEAAFKAYFWRSEGYVQLFPIHGAGHGFKKKQDMLAKAVLLEFLNGAEEVLTIHVRLAKSKLEVHGFNNVLTLPFEGFAESRYFTGVIQAGAEDVQRRRGLRPVSFCADYLIKGTDFKGQPCGIHITNRTADGVHWFPSVETDSKALAFLNSAGCTAILENCRQGPIIHLYAERKSQS